MIAAIHEVRAAVLARFLSALYADTNQEDIMEAGSRDMLLAIISNLRNAEYQLIVLEAHYNKEGNSLDASRVVRDLPGIQDTAKRLIQLVA